ncbi:MAG: hypothetical protein SFY95_08905 [Planctomycetota bacterium]|nr:hypothetical protein [Planctomycetota bacterium]
MRRQKSVLGSMGLKVAAASVAAMTAAAAGQTCWVFRPGVPDFDQKRNGLGNDGRNHCVPTSWTNWFAFFQNNGYGGLMGLPAIPVNWQTWNHNYVTGRIDALGVAMGTNPFSGTSGNAQQFLDYVNNNLTESAYILRWADGIWPEDGDTTGPEPRMGAAMLKMGAAVVMTIGWSSPSSSAANASVWKDGSHVVALNGVYGLCSSEKSVRYRDPGTDGNGSLSSQSTFVSEMSVATPWSGQMRFGGNPMLRATTAFELEAYGDRRAFIFGFRAMMLNFGVGIDTQSGGLVIHRPQMLTSVTLPVTERIDFPGNAAVVDFEFLPNMVEGVAVVGGATPQLWKLDLAFGEHVKLADLERGGPVTTSRFGDVYVADGSKIKRFDPRTEREVGFVAPGVDVMALTYDDSLDEVVGLSQVPNSTRGDLVQMPRDLQSVLRRTLPSGVPVSRLTSIGIHPQTRALWVSVGDGSVREVTRPRAGALGIARWQSLPGVTRAERMRFMPDGGLIVYNGAALVEFGYDSPAMRFIIGKVYGFSDGPIDALFTTGQSRDDTPRGRENEIDPEVLPPGPTQDAVPDCPADYDGSLFADSDDFAKFNEDFIAGKGEADVDASGFVDSDDYVAFLQIFSQGC